MDYTSNRPRTIRPSARRPFSPLRWTWHYVLVIYGISHPSWQVLPENHLLFQYAICPGHQEYTQQKESFHFRNERTSFCLTQELNRSDIEMSSLGHHSNSYYLPPSFRKGRLIAVVRRRRTFRLPHGHQPPPAKFRKD